LLPQGAPPQGDVRDRRVLLAEGTKEDNRFGVDLDGRFVALRSPMMGSGCPLVHSPAAGRLVRDISSHIPTHPGRMVLPLSLPACGLRKQAMDVSWRASYRRRPVYAKRVVTSSLLFWV
jgi:hypothetical protein